MLRTGWVPTRAWQEHIGHDPVHPWTRHTRLTTPLVSQPLGSPGGLPCTAGSSHPSTTGLTRQLPPTSQECTRCILTPPWASAPEPPAPRCPPGGGGSRVKQQDTGHGLPGQKTTAGTSGKLFPLPGEVTDSLRNQTSVPNPSGPSRLAPWRPHLCSAGVSEGADPGGQHPLLRQQG